MINKKVTLDIMGGKRDKQQVLKEFARPAESNTISSSPSISTGGYGGGNIPGCGASGPTPQEPCADIVDLFVTWEAWVRLNYGVFIPDEDRRNHTPALYGLGNPGILEIATDPDTDPDTIYWSTAAVNIGFDRSLNDNAMTHRFVFKVDPDSDGTAYFGMNVPEIPTNKSTAFNPYGSNTVTIEWDHVFGSDMTVTNNDSDISTVSLDSFFIPGDEYGLDITARPFKLTAKIWKRLDPEDSVTLESVTADTAMQRVGFSFANGGGSETSLVPPSKLEILYAAALVVGDGECGNGENTGYVEETLTRESHYWRPTPIPDSIQYVKVYFDGAEVQKGVHYTIVDEYKIVPVNPALPSDTEVIAMVIRNA